MWDDSEVMPLTVCSREYTVFLTYLSPPPSYTPTEEYPLALGKAVSKKNREGLQLQVQSFVYGETEFHTVGNFLEKIKTVYGRPDQVHQPLFAIAAILCLK